MENLLHLFFNSKSDASPLEASQQEQLEKEFGDWLEGYQIVFQREKREAILLSITGVKRNDNQTFTLENVTYDYMSNVIDVKEILDCSEERFMGYFEEFKETERLNYLS